MLTYLDRKDKNSNIQLSHLMENIYIPTVEHNGISFLKRGSRIWVDEGDFYNVYTLNENYIGTNDNELRTFVERIIESVG